MMTRPIYYRLTSDYHVEPCDAEQGRAVLDNVERRRVGWTEVTLPSNEVVVVSTIFLAIDHSFGAEGGPVLFETMIGTPSTDKDGPLSFLDYQWRYETWKEAEAGHARVVETLTRYGLPEAESEPDDP